MGSELMVFAWGQHDGCGCGEFTWNLMWVGDPQDNVVEQALEEMRRLRRQGFKAVRFEWRGDSNG
jgi:hypothetical protein